MGFCLNIRLESDRALDAWLGDRCRLPRGAGPPNRQNAPRSYSGVHETSEAPQRMQCGVLWADGVSIDFERSTILSRRPRISVYDAPIDWGATRAGAYIAHFDTRGAYYGFACDFEELKAHNLFQYDLWGNGRMSSVMVGLDPDRRIPGLYWLNYFSHQFLADHAFDADMFKQRLNAAVVRLPGGLIVRLYEHPTEWHARREAVNQVVESDDRFFRLSLIEPPGDLAPPEFVDFLGCLGAEWP